VPASAWHPARRLRYRARRHALEHQRRGDTGAAAERALFSRRGDPRWRADPHSPTARRCAGVRPRRLTTNATGGAHVKIAGCCSRCRYLNPSGRNRRGDPSVGFCSRAGSIPGAPQVRDWTVTSLQAERPAPTRRGQGHRARDRYDDSSGRAGERHASALVPLRSAARSPRSRSSLKTVTTARGIDFQLNAYANRSDDTRSNVSGRPVDLVGSGVVQSGRAARSVGSPTARRRSRRSTRLGKSSTTTGGDATVTGAATRVVEVPQLNVPFLETKKVLAIGHPSTRCDDHRLRRPCSGRS
jgi:hypothetical protein